MPKHTYDSEPTVTLSQKNAYPSVNASTPIASPWPVPACTAVWATTPARHAAYAPPCPPRRAPAYVRPCPYMHVWYRCTASPATIHNYLTQSHGCASVKAWTIRSGIFSE